ncbi:hypothetical protein FGO68_gene16300 [Halteria grandinella]|uniref:Amino acid transporter transmembrane domain-containing protein n=1 Tax=Halteria grandinella TaxID=5974 RepID=A0A8J8NVE1_HALGN|nr:hypothetical protein FGO68_gene16300 [Halteria grandinella]
MLDEPLYIIKSERASQGKGSAFNSANVSRGSNTKNKSALAVLQQQFLEIDDCEKPPRASAVPSDEWAQMYGLQEKTKKIGAASEDYSGQSEFKLFTVSVKLFFGISYLSMPNTFAQCGIFGGIALFTIMIVVNGMTMMQLLKVAEAYRDVKSYSDLGERIFGKHGQLVVDICILIKQVATCVTYLYFVATQLDFIICRESSHCLGNKIYMLVLIIPVIMMSSIMTYQHMSYLSIPSICIALTGMLCIFYYSFSQMTMGLTSSEELVYFDFWKVVGRMGLAMYLFDGTAMIVNVSAEAGPVMRKRYPKILMKAIIFDLTLFILFASICYYVYREDSQPIFTMSLVPINSMVIVIFGCVCINALTSYPMQILSAFTIIEKFIMIPNDQEGLNAIKRVTLRALIIIMTTLLCMMVKTFTDFINIAGALGSVTVAFILPQLFYLKTFKNSLSIQAKIGCYSIAIFGLIGGSYSIYYSIHKLMQGDFS